MTVELVMAVVALIVAVIALVLSLVAMLSPTTSDADATQVAQRDAQERANTTYLPPRTYEWGPNGWTEMPKVSRERSSDTPSDQGI